MWSIPCHFSQKVVTLLAIASIIGCLAMCMDFMLFSEMSSKKDDNSSTDNHCLSIFIFMVKEMPNGKIVKVIAWLLLLVSGDVELNPGPITSTRLLEGLASLGNSALVGIIKNIILTWSINKDTRTDLNRFKVDDLKTALAWLRNWDIQCTQIKGLKKQQLIEATLIAIERLLPDFCDECNEEYKAASNKEN